MVRGPAPHPVPVRSPSLSQAEPGTPSPPPGRRLCLAVDVGGTKLAVGLVDRDGSLLWQDRVRTPKATDGDALYRVVEDLVLLGLDEAGGTGEIEVVGVGCGGPMTAGGEAVSPLNIPAWRGFPLRSRLSASLARVAHGSGQSPPAFVDNDAKALALGEGWVGAAQGESDFLAMVVSTGVGGGIVLGGRLVDGAAGNAGHIGHVVVEPEGHECGCGARGCLEAEASGSGIARWTGQPAAEATPEVVERTGRLVGRAVASAANLLDLRLAVVAGSVALGFGVRFFIAAQRELDARARLEFSRGCRIEPAGLGATGPLVGAAAVGWHGLEGKRPA